MALAEYFAKHNIAPAGTASTTAAKTTTGTAAKTTATLTATKAATTTAKAATTGGALSSYFAQKGIQPEVAATATTTPASTGTAAAQTTANQTTDTTATKKQSIWEKIGSYLGNSTDTTLPTALTGTNEKTAAAGEYLAGRAVSGALSAARGLVNEIGYLGQGAAAGAYAQTAAQNEANDAMKALVTGTTDTATASPVTQNAKAAATYTANKPLTDAVSWGKNFTNSLSDYDASKETGMQKLGGVAENIGFMVPSILSNYVVPGSSLFVMATGAAGNATSDAIENGASNGAALAYGAAVGLTEAATEKIFDGVGGIFGKGWTDDWLQSAVSRAVENPTAQKAILTLADTLGEGFEEWIAEYAEAYENKLLVQQDTRDFKQLSSDALYSAALGSLLSVIMQSTNLANLSAQDAGEAAALDTAATLSDQTAQTETQTQEAQAQTPAQTEAQTAAQAAAQTRANTGSDSTLAAQGAQTPNLNVNPDAGVDTRDASEARTEAPAALQSNAAETSAQTGVERTDSVGAATRGFDRLGALVGQYGAIPEGENPHSTERVTEDRIPAQTADDNKVSQTVRTAYEAPATPNATAEKIETATLNNLFSYKSISDRAALSRAEKTIKDKGFETAYSDWHGDVKAGKVSKNLTALGWTLYNNAANAGDGKAAVRILTDLTQAVRSGAQSLQAVKLLKKMSPEYKLYAIQRSVENLKAELQQKYGDRAPDLQIDDTLAQNYLDALNAKDNVAAKKALKDIYNQIGSQIPSTFVDKMNAWRYLSMLFNPTTHIKNIVGNYAFAGVRSVKNVLSASVQSAVNAVSKATGKGGIERTRSIALTKKDAALIRAATADYAEVSDEIFKLGKYDDAKSEIEDARTIFSGKALERTRKVSSTALDTEDLWVARPAYVKALAGYLKANGVNFQTADSALLDRARSFAIEDARKATYRDANAFSDFVSRVGRGKTNSAVGKVAQTLAEGVLPFRRTPANILLRGLEYSPAGLVKAVSVDSVKLAKGDITAADFIDNVSSGLTGTALFGLGAFLAAEGLLTVGGSGDDRKDKLLQTEGYQDYAINVGGKSYTIDFLAPAAMPLFMGGAFYNLLAGKSDTGATLETVLKAATDVTGPMLETSMLSSLNDFLDGFAYADQQDENLLYYGIAQAAMSYLGQYVPTIGGRIARTIDATRRTTVTDSQSGIPTDLQYFWQQQEGKIPVLASTKQEYVDQWGRTQSSGNVGQRILQQFLSPGYVKDISVSAMETELLRLYTDYAEDAGKSVLPAVSVKKYFQNNGETVYMSADEYTQYKKTSGQAAYKALTALTSSAAYKAMTDEEKADAVEQVYTDAAEKAKTEVMQGRGELRIATTDAGNKIQSYMDDGGLTQKQAYSLYQAVNALEPAEGSSNVTDYQKAQTIAKQSLTQKQKTALIAAQYTTHDADGNVKAESLLPDVSISDHLFATYLTTGDSSFVNMTVPESFTADGETVTLSADERALYKQTFTDYLNPRATNVTSNDKLLELIAEAKKRAKKAVLKSRK